MSSSSSIEWTDATWNPVTGCSKVSPGCAHCYAEAISLRFGRSKGPWTPANAAENVVLRPDRLTQPLRWRKPRMIFVNSMSDLFHERVPDDYIARVWDVMADCPEHVFQILTKRPERMREWIAAQPEDPWPNIWLGTSIENHRFVGRADHLRGTPAAVRFVSAEPLLGPLAPTRMFCSTCSLEGPNERCEECEGIGAWWLEDGLRLDEIDWLIVGGESGRRHRPVQANWVRDLRDLANDYGTAFFFKQWGGRVPKAGGRELDGRAWDELPVNAAAVATSGRALVRRRPAAEGSR